MIDIPTEELMNHFRQGDTAALDWVLRRYQREICYFATGILKDRETAEEIVDDCFLKTWNARAQFNNLPDLKSYLYVVTRNACLDHLKSPRNRRMEFYGEQTPTIASSEDIEAKIIYTELLGSIYEEVSKLPQKQGQVFQLSYFDGLSVQEIAERLGITPNAVSIHKHEATKTIRRIFSDKNPLLYLLFIQYFN